MKKTYDELLNDFKADCKVVDLDKEYPNRVGNERYLIVTDLPNSIIMKKYASILKKYEPYCIVGSSVLRIINSFKQNEEKHIKREKRNHLSYPLDDITTCYFNELQAPDCADDFVSLEIKKSVVLAINNLSGVEKERIIKRYWLNYSCRKIAKIEGKGKTTITESIKEAKNKIRKIMAQFYEDLE